MVGRIRVIAALLCVVGLGSVAQPANAAVVGYRFDLYPDRTCPQGHGVAGETVTVTLRGRDGTRLARRTTATDASTGSFRVCLGAAATAGRTLVVKGTAGGHTLLIPRLDARVDRATEVLAGHAPAGATVQGAIYQCVPGLCAPELPVEVTASPQGTFTKDLSPTDIDGAEFVSLAHQTLGGDVIRFAAQAPYMEVRLPGPAQVRVWPARSGPVTVTLRTAGGALRASTTRTLSKGKVATFTFRRDGHPVRVRAGDRIDADFATDVGMTAPVLGLAIDVSAATVSGHCFANEWLRVEVIPTVGEATSSTEQAGADGSFTAELAALQAGWHVQVDCQDRHGDRFRLSGLAA